MLFPKGFMGSSPFIPTGIATIKENVMLTLIIGFIIFIFPLVTFYVASIYREHKREKIIDDAFRRLV